MSCAANFSCVSRIRLRIGGAGRAIPGISFSCISSATASANAMRGVMCEFSACKAACKSSAAARDSEAIFHATSGIMRQDASVTRSRSSSSPVRFAAITVITGTPIAFSNAAASIVRPSLFSASVIVSAMTTGSPKSSSWLVRYKLRSRLEASTTLTTRSGAGVSSRRPIKTSRAITSSGEWGVREYSPGRSISRAAPPSGRARRPSFFSTVTPGVVADLLPQSRQGVKKRSLATVRIANQSNRRRMFHFVLPRAEIGGTGSSVLAFMALQREKGKGKREKKLRSPI